tara:strand:- start:23438 stop:24301 length:864 start_codon:yes stop_codon:yes gene_type:complete
MLKKRIVATVVVKDGIVVQSINFKKFLPIGKPHIAIEYLNKWGIDEIVLLDISATKNRKNPDFEMVKKCSKKCFVPLTYGGGIKSIEHIDNMMSCGADKIAINSSSIQASSLINEASSKFGSQCVVISIDAIKSENKYKVYDYINKKPINISPLEHAKKSIKLGAGEIFINSVDRDGSYLGFDLELIKPMTQLNVPVVCCGGAKNAKDFNLIFKNSKVSGAAAANFFHFTEHSVIITKAAIENKNEIRIETHADYSESKFDTHYRLTKKSEKRLNQLLNIKIEKEII